MINYYSFIYCIRRFTHGTYIHTYMKIRDFVTGAPQVDTIDRTSADSSVLYSFNIILFMEHNITLSTLKNTQLLFQL